MPLIKSKSKAAFGKNVAAEVHAGKPVKQAVAIAYSVKRAAKHKDGGKAGLWDNIHAKQERIKHGSGEHMRKPGSTGAPTAADFKAAAAGTKKMSKGGEPRLSVSRGEKLPTSRGAGLTQKGRDKFNRATGSHLKAPQAKGARHNSFCARMSGMPGPMKDEKGRPTRKAASLHRWHCATGGKIKKTPMW